MPQFTNNHEKSQFEGHFDGHMAYASYHINDGTLYIDYVEAPPELRGTGAAGKLMEYVVAQAKEQNLKITPICGYAASWLKRNGYLS